MRKGMCGLSMFVQKVILKDPFSGHMFVFRGKCANYIKILYWDGNGARTLRLADHDGTRRHGCADAGAARDAD
jgi:transposase